MVFAFRSRPVFALLFVVPAAFLPSVLHAPAYAQGKKQGKVEEAGSYVYMEGTLGAGGASNNLYIKGNILGGLEGSGEYSSRPTHFWIKNTGSKSCFVSGEQTGFTVGSAGSEIKPGETLRSGLAIYRPQGNPISSINITLKAWVPTNPPPPKLDPLQARKLSDAQALIESSLQRYEAMKQHLQAGFTTWGQLPDAARDAAIRQQLDALAAKRQQALQHMGQYMEGYKRGDFSDLDALVPDVDRINTQMQEQANQLKLPTAPKQPAEPMPQGTGSDLFRNHLGREYTITYLDHGKVIERSNASLALMPDHVLRWTWQASNGKHVAYIPLDAIKLDTIHITDNSLGEKYNQNYSDGYRVDFSLSRLTAVADGGETRGAGFNVQIIGDMPEQFVLSFKSFIQEELGTKSKPAPAEVKPAIDPKVLQGLQAAHDALKQQTQSLPRQADTVSSLNAAPAAVRSQYAQILNGLEGKNVEAVSKSLAPDYFYKDAQGTVLPLSRWKAAQAEQLKTFPRLHMVMRVEGQEAQGNDLVVTATRIFVNVGGEGANSRLEQKVKETWTQASGQYLLQSTEVLSEKSSLPRSNTPTSLPTSNPNQSISSKEQFATQVFDAAFKGNDLFEAKKYAEAETILREGLVFS